MEGIERRSSRRARRRQGLRLVFGTLLLGIGGVLLASTLGLEIPLSIPRLWPCVVIALGAARLLLGSREEREGGFWILLGGVYDGRANVRARLETLFGHRARVEIAGGAESDGVSVRLPAAASAS